MLGKRWYSEEEVEELITGAVISTWNSVLQEPKNKKEGNKEMNNIASKIIENMGAICVITACFLFLLTFFK